MQWLSGGESRVADPSIPAETMFIPLQAVPESNGCSVVTLWLSWGIWHLLILAPLMALIGIAIRRIAPQFVSHPKYRLISVRLRNRTIQAGTLGGLLGGIFFLVIYLSVRRSCLYFPL